MQFNACGHQSYADLARSAPQYPDAESTSPYFVMRDAPKSDFMARAVSTNLAHFDAEEEAVACIGNCETFYGDVLRIEQDGSTIFDAEWDETLGRYLNR